MLEYWKWLFLETKFIEASGIFFNFFFFTFFLYFILFCTFQKSYQNANFVQKDITNIFINSLNNYAFNTLSV